MSYHDNKLNMVSLDDDDGDFEYKPAKKAGKESFGNTTKSLRSSTKTQKPASSPTVTKRKRGSTINNTPAKAPKKPDASTGDSLAPYNIKFDNTSEDIKQIDAQPMALPSSDQVQLSFSSGHFSDNSIASFSETLHNNHDDMLVNNFSNDFNMGNGLGIHMSTGMDNVMGGYMDTEMGNTMYHKHDFDFNYGYGLNTIDPRMLDNFKGSQEHWEHQIEGNGVYGAPEDDQIIFDDDTAPLMKSEKADREYSVSSPPNDNEYEDIDDERKRPSKVPKINKDGAPRKSRQPRLKLLKWSDDDWKNVALGLVWACGDNGIQIPFDQAAQVVGDQCTAGALQQALLKLRGKQIAEGYQIPPLKMSWARKNNNSPASSSADSKKNPEATPTRHALPKKKPTLMGSTQSLIVRLKRPYKEADRVHLDVPFKWAKNLFQKLKPTPAVYDWNVMNSSQETTAPYAPLPSTPPNSIAAESHVAANLNSTGMPQGNGIITFSNGVGDMTRMSWERLHELEGDVTLRASLQDFISDDVFL